MSPLALVVDDDDGVAQVTGRFLARMGWTVDITTSAHGAREKIAHRGYRLVVCDVNLGDEDGIEVVTVLRRMYPLLRVVIVSGLPENLQRAWAAGFTRCLQKPFTLSEFEALIGSFPPEAA